MLVIEQNKETCIIISVKFCDKIRGVTDKKDTSKMDNQREGERKSTMYERLVSN